MHGSNAVRSKLSILTGLIEQPRTPMPRTVSFTLLTRCATRRHLFQPGLIIERLGKEGGRYSREGLAKFGKLARTLVS